MAESVGMIGREGFMMANSVNIPGSSNQVEIEPVGNSVECSLFDVTTTNYFLSAAQILEEHREAD